MNQIPKCKAKTIKNLRQKHDLGIGNNLLYLTPKAYMKKHNKNQTNWISSKLMLSCFKDTIQKWKRQPNETKYISSIYPIRNLYPKYIKNSYCTNERQINQFLKIGK